MLNLNFDGARPECIDAEHHATASITASDGSQPARFRPVSYKYDTVLATDELPPGRGEDGHHYRDDELPSSRHPLYANNERQHQLQMVQS